MSISGQSRRPREWRGPEEQRTKEPIDRDEHLPVSIQRMGMTFRGVERYQALCSLYVVSYRPRKVDEQAMRTFK
jgi:hypothetical protein